MTYRERRERKAERLREWAEKRDAKADAAYAGVQSITERIPFGQPILVGHHSERGARADQRRIERGMDAFCENARKASEMRSRADNIEAQAKHAIYSDDPDAPERLCEKIAKLEAQRDAMKARNAEFRKTHRAELREMSAFQRDRAMPHPGYELTNLGATIRTTRKRLEQIEAGATRQAADRIISARFAGACADCGATIERGQTIRYSRAAGARCESCHA